MDQKTKLVHEVKFISVFADKAADSSNKEQLHLVLRFIDATNSVLWWIQGGPGGPWTP